MDGNLLRKIVKSNKSIWREENYQKIARHGLYEVYFVIFHNQATKTSYWIRYTVLCNKLTKNRVKNLKNIETGEGLLWFGFFDTKDSTKTCMIKKKFPLSKVKGTYFKDNQNHFLTIEEAYITEKIIKGQFKTKSGKDYSWDLTLDNFQEPYDVVPGIAKNLKISNTMNKATHPHCSISGTVLINGQTILIQNADAIQYHTFANGYSDPWEWFSCYTISEWPKGFIDFSYKKNKGILEVFNGHNRLTNWNKNLFSKLLKSKKLKRNSTFSRMMFNIEQKDIAISGLISVDENQIIGVEYKGPTGEKHYCYNSEVASGSLKIVKKEKKTKELKIMEFSIDKSIAFETTYNKPLKEVKYLTWENEEI